MAQVTMYPAQVNSPQTELTAPINDTDDIIPVIDADVLPDAPNLLVIGTDESAETVLFTGKSGNDLTGVTRGVEGTAQSWSAGSKIARNWTATDYEAMRSNIDDLDTRQVALQADITQRAINVMHPPSPLVAAVGDMVADDTAAIQTVINAVRDAGGGVVFFPVPSVGYKITSKLILYSNVTLQGANKGAIIDGTGLGSTLASQKTFIEAAGTPGTGYALLANANEGDASVTVTNASTLFAVGDWVQVYSNDLIDYNGTYQANKGEFKRILTVVGTTITFEDNLFDSYTTANAASVRKITFATNVTIRDLTIRGTNSPNGETAISLYLTANALVDNVNVKYVDIYQCLVEESIYTKVTKSHFDGVYYDQVNGMIFYAVAVVGGSQWTEVIGNTSNKCRHLFVCTSRQSGSGKYGQPLFVNVTGNSANYCNQSYAYNHHGFGRFINIIGNTANDCYAGASIEGSDVIAADNIFYNCSNYGVVVQLGRNIKNINIHDNKIKRCKGQGINIIGISGYAYDKIKIHDNEVDVINTVDGIRVNQYVTNASIRNNELFGAGGTLGLGLYNQSPKAKIGGNTISNFSVGLYNEGALSRLIDNSVLNTSNSHAIQTTAKSIISENTIDTTIGSAQGVSLSASGATGSIVTDNHFVSIGGFCIAVNNAVNDCVIQGNHWKGNTNGLSIGTGTGHIYQTAAGDKYNRD